eukprot:jgi/Tetstr1/435833/TSEL_024721.t1
MSKAQRQRQFLGNAKSLADVKLKSGQPLDYSFKWLTSLTEILEEQPNSGTLKGADVSAEEKAKYELNSTCLRISNNTISTLQGLPEVLDHVMDAPEELSWLDASFNKLTSIEDIIATYPNLVVLYLHANCLTNIREVKKLAKLPNLRKLTLHGNPLEEMNQGTYKMQVLAYLPNLRTLDFIAITKVDKDKASVWYASKMKKK